MRIVLALDSSALSQIVVNEVTSRPWPQGTGVHVLHVVDEFTLVPEIGPLQPFIESETEQAKALVQTVAGRLQAQGLEVVAEVRRGYPSTSIVDYARQWNADFIIVGACGHSGITRLLIGSVAKSVLRHAHCSVEIVRATNRQKTGGAAGMKILLATDGSDFSLAAARSVAERPWPEGTEVKVVSVVGLVVHTMDPWYQAAEIMDRIYEENRKLSEEAVIAARKIITNAGLKASEQILMGSHRWRILDEAKEWGADLIVVGSHGRRGMTRLLLGSVSETVASHAHCSVDVIRDQSLLNKIGTD